jgi:hypothetical protein
MFDKEYEKEILKISMSDNIIGWHIQDISQDIESQVIANIKESGLFAIQLDESTHITGRAKLLAFSRFVFNGDIFEKFLFCKPLQETTNFQDMLDVVDIYFSSHDLSWKSCICMDSAPSMFGTLKGFITLAKQKTPGIVFTHCFLHREAFILKLVVPEVQKVLDETIKMVSYIKRRPLQLRLFSALCSAIAG